MPGQEVRLYSTHWAGAARQIAEKSSFVTAMHVRPAPATRRWLKN